MDKRRLAAAYARLRASERLAKLVRLLPIRDISETTAGYHVYSGRGFLSTGVVAHAARITVSMDGRELVARVQSETASIDVSGPLTEPALVAESLRQAIGAARS